MNQPTDPQPGPVWVDGDPYLEASATAIWAQCNTDGHSSVVDDPRTVVAVAAAVHRADALSAPERQLLAFALNLTANQMYSRGDEFTDEDDAALASLRRLTTARPDDTEAKAVSTPCSLPDPCHPDGDLCDRHETDKAHAEGEHAYCGVSCEVEFPTDMLRNTIIAGGIPGTAGMLDELLRRATPGAGA